MSQISKTALKVVNNSNFPDNNTGYITPSLLRAFNVDVIDSTVNQTSYSVDIAAIQSEITALEAFTASQQPSFTALNSFTASQLTINSGVNSFTQSATGRLNNLESYTASFTTSVGIFDESTFVNNVNQINFMGNGISASFVSGKGVVAVDFTPLNQYTASTTTQLNSLQSNFNSFTQSTDNSIALIEQVTASYATTGSNSFAQNQFFEKNISVTQSVYVGQNLYVQGGIEATYIKTIFETSSVIYSSGSNQLGDALNDTQILSGSTFIEGQLYVNKLNVTDQFALLNQFTASTNASISALNTFTQSYSSSVSASFATINLTTQSLQSQLATIGTQSGSWITESETGSFAILAANQTFTGNNTITGNFVVSQSAAFGTASFFGPVSIDKGIVSNVGLTGSLTVVGNGDVFLGTGDPSSTFNGIGLINGGDRNFSILEYGSSSAVLNFGAVDATGFTYSTEFFAQATPSQLTFQDFNLGSFAYNTWLTLPANNGSNPAPFFNRGIRTSGSVTITGSAYFNVISQSIVSSTASIDLSRANFYTVALPSSTTTRLNITSPGAGQSAMIQITSNTNASASFSSNVKQPSGFAYIPSTGAGDIDVLTLASFDGVNVLVTNVTKLV